MILCANAAFAGAWTREAGSLYAKAGADVYASSRFVAPAEGTEEEQGTYFAHQYGVYGEAGLLRGHGLQVQVQAPLTVGVFTGEVVDAFRTTTIRTTTARLGDLQVGLQTALHPEWPVSAAVVVKVPLYANGSVGAQYATFAEVFPKPGDGQVDVTGWLYAGSGLPKGGFAEAGIGYRHRTEAFVGWPGVPSTLSFVDGLAFTAKAGRAFGPVLPIVGVDGVVPFVQDDWTRQFVSLAGSALIDVGGGWAIEPRLAGELHARRASKGIGGGVGVSYRR